MYLCYLDESGNPDSDTERHFVLAGAAVFERQTYHLSRALDGIQTRLFPGAPHVDFHASPIRAGKGFWRRVPKETRAEVLSEIRTAVATANHPGLVLFAAVIDKRVAASGEDVVRRATEQCCRRFDLFLNRRREAGDPQRGLLIFAEGRFDQRAKLWVTEFRELGTTWGVLRYLSDIPYFASAKETRPLQVADYIAHSLYALYEHRDPSLVRDILPRFDRRDGVLHGLVHVTPDRHTCDCPACHSRRIPGVLGPWVNNVQPASPLSGSRPDRARAAAPAQYGGSAGPS